MANWSAPPSTHLLLLLRYLAVRRIVDLVVSDEITRTVRVAVSDRWPDSKLAYALGCRRCVSVWAGIAVIIAPAWLTEALALSAATIAADEWRAERGARALERRLRASTGTARQSTDR